MMYTYQFIYVLLASNALVLCAASLVLVRSDRRQRRLEQFWSSPTAAALTGDNELQVREQVEATQRLEKSMGELQRAVNVMDIKKHRPRPAAERNLPIENAIRMARLGASIEELTRSCGLNIGEARLMQKLHGKARVAAGAN